MISKATLGRLPTYLKYLTALPDAVTAISATTLAKELSLGEVQVRKDLASVCGKGKPKVGYEVKDLVVSIKRVISLKPNKEAIIVGAGKLGTALLGYPGFSEYGLIVSKAFDVDDKKCGGNVLPMSELQSYIRLHQVELGVLTVPAGAAQSAADEMVKGGVRAIWCFSPTAIKVPDGVIVQYENLALSLAHLQNKSG